ncbi:MAG: RNA recognition motif domain-containing protein [Desulfosudaceae bacterium]
MNIYVGNLPAGFTQASLEAMFAEFGEVENVKLISDRFSGQPKGYGFVEMPSNSEADKAIKALNRKFVDGSTIKVNQANPDGKKNKKRSSRRRGPSY